MKPSLLVLLICVSCVMTNRMIISFSSDECFEIGLKYVNQLQLVSKSVQSLGNLGMLIVDIESHQLTEFLAKHEEFRNCIGEISQDGQVSLDLPPQNQVYIANNESQLSGPQTYDLNTIPSSCNNQSNKSDEANI